MSFGILLDLLVAGLLATAIGYCMLLNRKLGALRADKAQLAETVRGLTEISLRAEAGIAKLKESAEQLGRALEQKIEAGQGLHDDLAYMIDRGAGLADRLAGGIRKRREDNTPATERPAPKQPAPARDDSATGAIQNRLRDLLRRAEPVGPAVRLATDKPAKPPVAAAPAATAQTGAPVAGFPSRAERDLRRAVEGRRR
jgi:hypothetical protein